MDEGVKSEETLLPLNALLRIERRGGGGGCFCLAEEYIYDKKRQINVLDLNSFTFKGLV